MAGVSREREGQIRLCTKEVYCELGSGGKIEIRPRQTGSGSG